MSRIYQWKSHCQTDTKVSRNTQIQKGRTVRLNHISKYKSQPSQKGGLRQRNYCRVQKICQVHQNRLTSLIMDIQISKSLVQIFKFLCYIVIALEAHFWTLLLILEKEDNNFTFILSSERKVMLLCKVESTMKREISKLIA